MNIIIFTHNYPISRFERRNAGIFVHDLAKELSKTNSVTVICPGSFNKKSKFGNITVYFFGWGRNKHLGKLRFYKPLDIFYGFNLFFQGIKTLLSAVKETKPEFTLAMWAIPSGFFGYFTKIIFGVPYAIWVLGSDFYVYAKIPLVGFFIRYVLKEAKYTFADGISLSEEVSQVTGRRCLFLPSSTNLEVAIKKKKNSYNHKIVLTFIGRMELIKGPDVLVDAILELKDKIKNFRFNFLGDGSLLSILKKRVAKVGVEDHVFFYGNVDSKVKIINLLNNSHWLIIPSRSDSIPLVFSEAMKVGIPVIASDLPDLKYFIDNYKVGLFFTTGDHHSLAAIISGLDGDGIGGLKRMKFLKNVKILGQIFSLKNSTNEILKTING